MFKQTKQRITERIFASYLDCTYKAFLQLHGHEGKVSEYEQHRSRLDVTYRSAATARLEALYAQHCVLRQDQLTVSNAQSSRRLILTDEVEIDGLSAEPIVLLAVPNNLEPIQFHRYPPVTPREKLLLGYKAVLLGRLLGRTPTKGLIVRGEKFEVATIPLLAHTKKAESVIAQLMKLSARKEEELFLNSHCQVCEFMDICRTNAETEDNMSLLQGMRRGHIENLIRRASSHYASFHIRFAHGRRRNGLRMRRSLATLHCRPKPLERTRYL